MSDTDMSAPPRPRLAFRIGIIGHRPNRLPADTDRLAELRRTLRAILSDARDALLEISKDAEVRFYRTEQPLLRAVSPLAEGSDRIFAEEALALGYELCCPMPFYQEEFEKDFVEPASLETGSLQHFRSLLDQARNGPGLTKFEMDGERAKAEDAYGAAGRVVLNQTDLLVAVWDGGEAQGRGGTVHTLHEAIRYHVPVIWIDALKPDAWQTLHAHADLEQPPERAASTTPTREHLKKIVAGIVRAELRLPPHDPNEISSSAQDYFAEHVPKINFGFMWKMFRNLVADGRLSLPIISTSDFATQIGKEWAIAADGGPLPSSVADWINKRLRLPFAWADGLADFYADAHRSAFVASYLLAALAVLAALVPIVPPPPMHPVLVPTEFWAVIAAHRLEAICGVIELCVLGLILWLLIRGRSHHWHERWTDYRLLAELARELCFLVPLGGGKPLPRIPAHLAVYGDPARTWMYWYVRAITREVGIPTARVTPEYMRDCVDSLGHVVGDEGSGQRGFHLTAARRARNLGERLRMGANRLFVATLIGVGVRLLLSGVPHATDSDLAWLDRGLLAAAAVLPALGAALEGINNQGEFIRIGKRSAAMASGFGRYAAKIASLKRGPPPKLAEVIPLSGDISEAMVAEVVDWRAVIIDRPQ